MSTSKAATARLLLVHPDPIARGVLRSKIERMFPRLLNSLHRGIPSPIVEADTLTDANELLVRSAHVRVVVIAIGRPSEAIVEGVRKLAKIPHSLDIILLSEQPLSVDECYALVSCGISALIDADESADALLVGCIQESLERFETGDADGLKKPNAVAKNYSPGGMIWQSPAMHTLIEQATRAAQISDIPVLILGESGTGKQLLAQYIHGLDSKRGKRKLQSVNCSTISGTLADSMLFGHRRGAFTGASEARKGIFRSAEGGTVLLDEIGEMDLALQPKLLHVLQERVVTPLGSDQSIECDVRVIAATNRRLPALIQEGKFRLDLYQRLNVIALEIPPLRERPEDIALLVDFFLQKYANYYEHPIESVAPEVYAFFRSCTLEGNVRQLENAIRQTLALKASGRVLVLDDIPSRLRAGQYLGGDIPSDSSSLDVPVLTDLVDAACKMVDSGSITLPEFVNTCEETALRKSLANSTSSSRELADKLGVSRRTLYNKLRKYGLKPPVR